MQREAFRLNSLKIPASEWPENVREAYNEYMREVRARRRADAHVS